MTRCKSQVHTRKKTALINTWLNGINVILILIKSKAARIEEVEGIRSKFPNKVPVIVEKFHKEKSLPQLDKSKFLVPQELTMSQFVTIIRYFLY